MWEKANKKLLGCRQTVGFYRIYRCRHIPGVREEAAQRKEGRPQQVRPTPNRKRIEFYFCEVLSFLIKAESRDFFRAAAFLWMIFLSLARSRILTAS